MGFCMAMGRDWLRRLPALDTAFGRATDEEVDWCRRASALGGRHLAAANLFVEHRGASSFGSAEKAAPDRAQQRRDHAAPSRLRCGCAAVLRDDPLTAPRLALAITLAAMRQRGRMPIYLGHSLGGGAEDYLAARIAADLAEDGPGAAIVLRVGGRLRWQVELHLPEGRLIGATNTFALVERLLDPCSPAPSSIPAEWATPTPPRSRPGCWASGSRLKTGSRCWCTITCPSARPTRTDSDGRHRGLPIHGATSPRIAKVACRSHAGSGPGGA